MKQKILIAGESWLSTTTHTKGFDSFTTSVYEEGVKWLKDALISGGYEVDFLPNHEAAAKFPSSMEEINKYAAIILSDIGSNTLLLHPETFSQSRKTPNRCDLIRDYVLGGGSLCMVGGYMTFTGIDAKGRWGQTTVGEVLPVDLLLIDDRAENPQGIIPKITKADHPIFNGIPDEFPALLGYNKTIENTAKGTVIATIKDDPLIAVGSFGRGKSVVFTSDCSPHWAPLEFCNWEYYNRFWINLIGFVSKKG